VASGHLYEKEGLHQRAERTYEQVKVMDTDYRIREESGWKKVKSEEPKDAIIDEDRKAG
jgi:hypothetical protein